jgi:hypothetical protein
VSETLSSLNFASRVRGIELGPAKKQIDTAELQKVKQMVRVNIAFSRTLLLCLLEADLMAYIFG